MTQETRPFSLLTPTASTLAASAPAKRVKRSSEGKPPSLPLASASAPSPPISPAPVVTIPGSTASPSKMATAKMDIVSPASPMGLRLTSDINKAATVFLSHVRRTFARFPVDYTGELVRLLDDIASFTCSTASSVMERSSDIHYGTVGTGADVNANMAIRRLYRLLAHDGYCCIILAKGCDKPLTFADNVLHGNYVVCVTPLDMDDTGSDERGVAGMMFSVYKRKSSASLPGRGMDLRQNLGDQVAAGYASFSSATTLCYTMGHGTYSFVLHPVALQYFLQPAMRLAIPENPTTMYSDRALLHRGTPISNSVSKMVDKLCCSMFTTGCVVGDVHQLMQTGGVLVAEGVHLMCEAAPVAFVIEQCGGVATDEYGKRILDMSITEDYNVTVTLCLGTPSSHKNLELQPKGSESNCANGNGSVLDL